MQKVLRIVLDKLILIAFVIVLVGAFISKNLEPTLQVGYLVGGAGLIIGILLMCRVPFEKINWRGIQQAITSSTGKLVVLELVVAYQLLVVSTIAFETQYDAGTVRAIASGTHDSYYFSVNPNNLGLLIFERGVYLISHSLGLYQFNFVLDFVNVFLVDLALFLIALTLRNVRKRWNLWLLGPLAYVLAPWLVIVYSDTVVLPFVATMVLLIQRLIHQFQQRRVNYKWVSIESLLLGAVSCITYSLKPSAIIILLAVMVELVILLLGNWKTLKAKRDIVKKFTLMVVVFALSFAMVQVGVRYAENHQSVVSVQNGVTPMTPTHFILMGMNKQSGGRFAMDDYNYSLQFKTKAAQNRGNIELIKQRLSDFGFTGYLKFLLTKNFNNSSDGTFAWTTDSFFTNPSFKHHQFMRSLYYLYGSRLSVYMLISQLIWIATLVGVIFSFLDHSFFARVLRLSFYGLLLFLLFFEGGRSRYLIQGIPVIFPLAILGWDAFRRSLRQTTVAQIKRGELGVVLGGIFSRRSLNRTHHEKNDRVSGKE